MSKVDSDLISQYVVGLVGVQDKVTIKFTKESVLVATDNIPMSSIIYSEEKLKEWMSTPFGIVKTALHDILSGSIGDILAVSDYPSITVSKCITEKKTVVYELISEEKNLVVAGFTVDSRKMPPKCFTNCFVLNKKGKDKRVTGPAFDYFHQEILRYDDLSDVVIQKGAAAPRNLTSTTGTREMTTTEDERKIQIQGSDIFSKSPTSTEEAVVDVLGPNNIKVR